MPILLQRTTTVVHKTTDLATTRVVEMRQNMAAKDQEAGDMGQEVARMAKLADIVRHRDMALHLAETLHHHHSRDMALEAMVD